MNYNFYYDDENIQNREFSLISFDQIDGSFSADETVYRSVSVMASPSVYNPISSTLPDEPFMMQKPTLKRENNNKSQIYVVPSQNNSNFLNLTPSEYPDILMPANFDLQLSLESIYGQVDKFLKETNGVSFDFDSTKCQWTVVYMNGSTNLKFQIVVYEKSSLLNKFIVEGNRLMGDGFSFRSIFSQIKSIFIQSEEFRDFDSFSTSFPLPALTSCEDEIESTECLECIFSMARDDKIESQIESAKILCDLSTDPGMLQTMVDKGCLSVLTNLVCSSHSEWAQLHAMAALSNFADARLFQQSMICAGLLPVLFSLACDGPFLTAELRRSAVHILASLCMDCSSEVARELGHRELCAWMSGVEKLSDEKLRIHACRAKESLGRIVFAS